MALLDSLLSAIVRADGDALVMHVGERPYVVVGTQTVNISTHGLTEPSMNSMLSQMLPAEQLAQLEEDGAVEYKVPLQSGDRFSVVAARGGDDIWIEIRRRRPEPAPVVAPPVAAPAPAAVVAAAPPVETPPVAAIPEPVAAPPITEPIPAPVSQSIPEPIAAPIPEPVAPTVAAAIPAAITEPIAEPLPVFARDLSVPEVAKTWEPIATQPEPAPQMAPEAFEWESQPVAVETPPPIPQMAPEPVALAPEPIQQTVPAPIAVEPEAISQPVPEPVAVVPEPAPQIAEPEPVPQMAPEPVALAPEPIPQTAPAPIAAEPEPISQPVPEPVAIAPDPIPQMAPKPVMAESAPLPELAPAMEEVPPAIDTAAVETIQHLEAVEQILEDAPKIAALDETLEVARVEETVEDAPKIAALEETLEVARVEEILEQAPKIAALAETLGVRPFEPIQEVHDVQEIQQVQGSVEAVHEVHEVHEVHAGHAAHAVHAGQTPHVSHAAPPVERVEPAQRVEAIEPPRELRAEPIEPPRERAPLEPLEPAVPAEVVQMMRTVRIEVPPRTQPPSQSRAATGIERLLRIAASRGASALFLTSDSRPWIRVEGDLRYLDSETPLSSADVESAIAELAPESGQESAGKQQASEWVAEFEGIGRIRCTTFEDHRGPGVLLRLIAAKAATAEALGLSREVQALATETEGIVLVAGPLASGKSTVMSALVDLVNRQRPGYVITLERQIRLAHDSRTALVSQREIWGDENDVVAAARSALRENPDVLVIDDLVSAQMVPLLLNTAEKGLLVFVSITAPSTAAAVERFVELAPPELRKAVQGHLAESFRGAVSQMLLKKIGGGLAGAREVLLATAAVSRVIAEGQFSQLPATLESGRRYGMVSFTDSLADLVRAGSIDARDAFRKAPDRNRLLELLRRDGVDTGAIERLS